MNLLKEPLYAATIKNQEWGPEELSEPFDLDAYMLVNASLILQEWMDYGAPGETAPNGDHTYTSHDGEDTVQLTVVQGDVINLNDYAGDIKEAVAKYGHLFTETEVIKTDGKGLL
jgi:hypothetical protein